MPRCHRCLFKPAASTAPICAYVMATCGPCRHASSRHQQMSNDSHVEPHGGRTPARQPSCDDSREVNAHDQGYGRVDHFSCICYRPFIRHSRRRSVGMGAGTIASMNAGSTSSRVRWWRSIGRRRTGHALLQEDRLTPMRRPAVICALRDDVEASNKTSRPCN
jgi:hypothetical protein